MRKDRSRKSFSAGAALGALLVFKRMHGGSQLPAAARAVAPAFKEEPPDGWKEAQPSDAPSRANGGRSITIRS